MPHLCLPDTPVTQLELLKAIQQLNEVDKIDRLLSFLCANFADLYEYFEIFNSQPAEICQTLTHLLIYASRLELKKQFLTNLLVFPELIAAIYKCSHFLHNRDNHDRLLEIMDRYYNHTTLRIFADTEPTDIEEATLTIITEINGGLGDYYAAKILIDLLFVKYPTLKINWVILPCGASKIPDDFEHHPQIQRFVDPYFFQLHLNTLTTSNAIFLYPDCHSTYEANLNRLTSLGIPVIVVSEYNRSIFPESEDSSRLISLNTGLGEDRVGIFMHQYTQTSYPLVDISAEPIAAYLLRPHIIAGVTLTSDHLRQTEEIYRSQNALFFGYFCKDNTSVLYKKINWKNYTDLCLALSRDKSNIDIILPITLEEATTLNQDQLTLHGIRQLCFISQSADGISETVIFSNEVFGKKLRIINLFPFPREVVLKLMQASIPFIGCTGDQSLSEVLSLPTGIPFYQTMLWKKDLLNALYILSQRVNGDSNPLTIYLNILQKDTYNHEEILECILHPDITTSLIKLKSSITNLFDTLPRVLSQIIAATKSKASSRFSSVIVLAMLTTPQERREEKTRISIIADDRPHDQASDLHLESASLADSDEENETEENKEDFAYLCRKLPRLFAAKPRFAASESSISTSRAATARAAGGV